MDRPDPTSRPDIDFGVLYQEHRRLFYALALSVTGSPESAEDAVHEAFARLVARQGDPIQDPLAFACTAVRRAAIDQRRQAGRRVHHSLFAEGEEAAVESPSHLEEREERQRLQAAVDALADELREVLLLRVWGGMGWEQIAQVCEAPVSTVFSRYRRGLDEVRRLIGEAVA